MNFRRYLRIIAVAGLFSTFTIAVSPTAHGQLVAPAGAVTIGAFLNGLRSLVEQLETSASALLSQGNNSLAQQQLILAGTISATIQQISSAYAGALDKTFSQIDTTELNAFSDVATITRQITNLEGRTSADVQQLLYKTQGAANQLLDRIPLTKRAPIFYGVSARDILADESQSPADVEIFGFAFTDSHLQFKKPVIKIANRALDPRFVSVQQDKIQIQIPDQLKTQVGFGGGPCSPRQTFPIDLEVFYSDSQLFGLWHTERNTTFHANVLPAPASFELTISFSGTRSDITQKSEPFSAASGSVNVGCENSGSTSVAYQLPSSAPEINCNAGWVYESNIKNHDQTACTVSGATASASGSIRGLDKQCIPGTGIFGGGGVCNCPGGGHGTLQISGAYKVPVTSTTDLKGVLVGSYALSSAQHTSVSLPSDAALRKTKIDVVVHRKSCPTVYDTISLAVPQNPAQIATQSSANGRFSATYRSDHVDVESGSDNERVTSNR